MNKRVFCQNAMGSSIWIVGLIAVTLLLLSSGLRPANSLESHYEWEPKVEFVDGTPNPVDPAGQWYTCINRPFIVDVTAEDEDSWMNSGVERYDNDEIDWIAMELMPTGEILGASYEPEVNALQQYGARIGMVTETPGTHPVIFRASDTGSLKPGNSNDPASQELSDGFQVKVFTVTISVDSGLPGTAWDANIPLNAEPGPNASVTVDLEPDCDDAAVQVVIDVPGAFPAKFGGSASTSLKEGETATLTGVATGSYTLKPYFDGYQCGEAVTGTVFELVLDSDGLADAGGGTAGGGERSLMHVKHSIDANPPSECGADQSVERYVWFITSPPGAYEGHVQAKLAVNQQIHDGTPGGGDPWGAAVINVDIYPYGGSSGGIGYSITLIRGLISVSYTPQDKEDELSHAAYWVGIKGVNESGWSDDDNEVSRKTTDIPVFQLGSSIPIETPVTRDTGVHNYYQVGESSSRCVAKAQISCDGSVNPECTTPNRHWAKGWVKLGDSESGVLEVSVVGTLTLTDPL